MTEVVVLIGAGSIGLACARRVAAGKHLLLADVKPENAEPVAEVLRDAGFRVTTSEVDVSSRESVERLAELASNIGVVQHVIHAAGVSPSQAAPEAILRVDLYGTALVLEAFGAVVAEGGSGVVIASQSGHRLPALTAEEDAVLALTPADELLDLPITQDITDPLHAYQVSKRGNALRVKAEAVRWGERGARINCISPGIILTPLARDELHGPRGAGYQAMIAGCPAQRPGTPDDVAGVAELLLGPPAGSSRAATSSWTAASRPPGSTGR